MKLEGPANVRWCDGLSGWLRLFTGRSRAGRSRKPPHLFDPPAVAEYAKSHRDPAQFAHCSRYQTACCRRAILLGDGKPVEQLPTGNPFNLIWSDGAVDLEEAFGPRVRPLASCFFSALPELHQKRQLLLPRRARLRQWRQ